MHLKLHTTKSQNCLLFKMHIGMHNNEAKLIPSCLSTFCALVLNSYVSQQIEGKNIWCMQFYGVKEISFFDKMHKIFCTLQVRTSWVVWCSSWNVHLLTTVRRKLNTRVHFTSKIKNSGHMNMHKRCISGYTLEWKISLPRTNAHIHVQ